MPTGSDPQPLIGGLPPVSEQLRAISSSISAQLSAALQGGCVAGDTSRHTPTRLAAASTPSSAAQDRGLADTRGSLIHLDGSIHLATTPALGAEMVAEGLGRPFPYAHGWTLASVDVRGVDGALALFRRNYDRLRPAQRDDGA